MPELPEVEYASRILREAVVGKTISRVRALHRSQRRRLPPRHAAKVAGATISAVERRGKHQLVALSTGDTLVVHFRMTGDWLVGRTTDPLDSYARVAVDLTDGTRVSLIDPRALSTVVLSPAGSDVLPPLGPDAADPNVDVGVFVDALSRRRVPIKVALLDQRVLAGVGNIYAAEALWLAKIDPRAVASSLTRARATKLLVAIRAVLERAQESSGRYRDTDEGRFAVYDREGLPCARCRTRIQRITQAGRSTYFCPRCQKR